MPRTLSLILLVALIVAPFAHSSFATTPIPNSSAHRERLVPLSARPVVGDFDGDLRLDQAELHLAGEHRCIRVRYGNSRENHLEFRAPVNANGALLARDINRDSKPDLIWISSAASESAVVWLGDGTGLFAEATGGDADALRDEFFGHPNLTNDGDLTEEQVCLTTDPISCEPARSANLDDESLDASCNSYADQSSDLGPYLSYLRERGPPSLTSF
ncbi:MAG TPA: hypothetical protein VLM38_15875 [Blastocatellia bacterium]|nr:hypothetical protein [Blastocatellia bacterium]